MALFSLVSRVLEWVYPVGIYLFKINNRNTRTRCEISSKLTTKTPERRQVWYLHIAFTARNHVCSQELTNLCSKSQTFEKHSDSWRCSWPDKRVYRRNLLTIKLRGFSKENESSYLNVAQSLGYCTSCYYVLSCWGKGKGGFVELDHFDKLFVKNTKKRSRKEKFWSFFS